MPPPVPGASLRLPESGSATTAPGKPPGDALRSDKRPPYRRWWFWAAGAVVIALGISGAVLSRLSTMSSQTTRSAPTTVTPTTIAAPSVSAIATSYNTVFNLTDQSISAKEAAIEDGAKLQAALAAALSWSLASSATGATVESVTLLPTIACRVVRIATPCAQVNYSILGPNGQPLLWNATGYAVEVDGQWLVASTTVCGVFSLFYQAEGNTGTAPGCPG